MLYRLGRQHRCIKCKCLLDVHLVHHQQDDAIRGVILTSHARSQTRRVFSLLLDIPSGSTLTHFNSSFVSSKVTDVSKVGTTDSSLHGAWGPLRCTWMGQLRVSAINTAQLWSPYARTAGSYYIPNGMVCELVTVTALLHHCNWATMTLIDWIIKHRNKTFGSPIPRDLFTLVLC